MIADCVTKTEKIGDLNIEEAFLQFPESKIFLTGRITKRIGKVHKSREVFPEVIADWDSEGRILSVTYIREEDEKTAIEVAKE